MLIDSMLRNKGKCSRDKLYCATARPLRRRLTGYKCSILLANTVVPRSALYLECASEKMTVVRQPCGKRRSVVEHVWLLALTTLELLFESISFFPKFQHVL